MLLRYYFELIVGIIFVIAILLFGSKGMAAFALLALLPLVMRLKKTKVDERELYVFYKAGNLTMGLIIASMFLINYFSDVIINGNAIGANWFPLSAGSLIMIHGLSGLLMNRSKI